MLIYEFNIDDLLIHFPLHSSKKPSQSIKVYEYKVDIDKLKTHSIVYLIEPEKCPKNNWFLYLHGAKFMNEGFIQILKKYGEKFKTFTNYISNCFENPYSFAVLSSILGIKIIYILYPGLGLPEPHYSYLIYPQYYLNLCLDSVGVQPNDHLIIQSYSAGAIVLNLAIQNNLFSLYQIDGIFFIISLFIFKSILWFW